MERPDLVENDLRIHYIKLTNNMDVPFTDMWDGIPVQIEPGKSDTLQIDMAAHFFGYHYGVDNETMFRHVCKRQGWNTIEHIKTDDSGKSLAQRMFSKLVITPVVYKMVEVKQDLDAPIPADPQPPPIEKAAAPKPPVDPDEIPPLPKRKTGAS